VPHLQELSFPGEYKDFDFLRRLPALQRLTSPAVTKKIFYIKRRASASRRFPEGIRRQKKGIAPK